MILCLPSYANGVHEGRYLIGSTNEVNFCFAVNDGREGDTTYP